RNCSDCSGRSPTTSSKDSGMEPSGSSSMELRVASKRRTEFFARARMYHLPLDSRTGTRGSTSNRLSTTTDCSTSIGILTAEWKPASAKIAKPRLCCLQYEESEPSSRIGDRMDSVSPLPVPSSWKRSAAWLIWFFSTVAERRSEEHTSELQSRFDLVCRLLLGEEMR